MIRISTILASSLFFICGISLPLVIIVYHFLQVYLFIQKSQKLLISQNIESQAKGKYILMTKKMGIFIISFLVTSIPFIISALYEWITLTYPPPIIDAFAGDLGIGNSAIFNPLLLLYLNYELQEIFIDKYSKYFQYFLINFHENQIFDESVTISDWKYWIEDPNLTIHLKKYCDMNYTTENYLFYKDYQIYLQLCLKFKKLININTSNISNTNKDKSKSNSNNNSSFRNSLYEDNSISVNSSPKKYLIDLKFQSKRGFLSNNNNSIHSETNINKNNNVKIEQLYEEIYEFANKLYKNYIEIPNAPLEINISENTRQKVYKIFKISKQSNILNNELQNIPKFELLNEFNFDYELKDYIISIITVYDICFETISNIIEYDIFPRFKKTTVYMKHNNNNKDMINNV